MEGGSEEGICEGGSVMEGGSEEGICEGGSVQEDL